MNAVKKKKSYKSLNIRYSNDIHRTHVNHIFKCVLICSALFFPSNCSYNTFVGVAIFSQHCQLHQQTIYAHQVNSAFVRFFSLSIVSLLKSHWKKFNMKLEKQKWWWWWWERRQTKNGPEIWCEIYARTHLSFQSKWRKHQQLLWKTSCSKNEKCLLIITTTIKAGQIFRRRSHCIQFTFSSNG